MATSLTLTTYKAALGECYDAITASNWSSAWTWYAKAEANLAVLELDVMDAGTRVMYRQSLKSLKDALTAAQSEVATRSERSRFVRTRTAFRG